MTRVLLLSVLLLAGCTPEKPRRTDYYSTMRVIRVEECKYVLAERYSGAVAMVHAGDCDNLLHLQERGSK